jgi:hypothetical protein
MTRPSGSFRPFIAILVVALFVSVQVVEGTGVHRCAAHDAGAGIQPVAAASSGHHHGGSADHGQKGRGADHHGCCPCLGDCQNSAVFTSPAVQAGPVASFVVTFLPRFEDGGMHRASLRYLLPFALGPPSDI